jgi:hypothetical protein
MIRRPAQEAEHRLGKELTGSIAASRDMSKARPEFGPLLREAAAREAKVDGTRILDKILSRVDETAVEPSRRAANDRLTQFAENFTDLMEPDGSLDVVKLDRFLRKDARGRIKDLLGREGGTDYQEALKDVQAFVREELHGTMEDAGVRTPSGLKPSQVQAKESVKIASRKRASAEFTRGVAGVPERPPTSNRIRNLFEPGNESKRDALLEYDRQHGTSFTARARTLAYKRDWNPDDRVAAHGLDRVLNLLFVGARPLAKVGAVVTRPLQAATAAFSDEMSRRMNRPNP